MIKVTLQSLVLVLAVQTIVGCHQEKRTNGGTQTLSPESSPFYSPPRTLTLAQCREELPNKIFVDPDPLYPSEGPNISPDWVRDEDKTSAILAVFDSLQAHQQKTFCTFDLILVTTGVGEGEIVYLKNLGRDLSFATLRLNPRVFAFDKTFTLAQYLSMRFQALFYESGIRDTYYESWTRLNPMKTDHIASPILRYILLHEIGHIFEKDNFPSDPNNPFAMISWAPEKASPGDFKYRRLYCKPQCMPYRSLPVNQNEEIFAELYEHEFISLYASWDAHEDFAESMAYISLIEDNGLEFEWVLPQAGTTLSLNKKIRSAVFSGKFRLIKDAITNPKFKHNFVDK